ncbi:aminopeptidase P family N-terminal domain-containing protein [Pseudonocardia sp. DLS-67]
MTDHSDLADSAEQGLRYSRVRAAMAEQGLDVLLAYGPGWRRENIRYLSDARVNGSAALVLLPAAGEPVALSTRPADLGMIAARGCVTDVARLDLGGAVLTERLRDPGAVSYRDRAAGVAAPGLGGRGRGGRAGRGGGVGDRVAG